jgi:hypothetical protein
VRRLPRPLLPLLLLVLTACGGADVPTEAETFAAERLEAPSQVAQFGILTTDGKPLIDPDELVDAATYDGIPAITNPVLLTAERADHALTDSEQVMLVVHGGEARAYPVRSLIRHEIVNDTLAGLPLAVTWCPLCNTGITFDRRVDGRPEEFRVSGALYRSALVMFDARTQSLWPQPLGKAVMGPLVGTELGIVPSSLLPWREVLAAHPDVQVAVESEVSLQETDNPYDGYDLSDGPLLIRGETDDRLRPFARVAGVTFGGRSVAWPYDLLRERRTVEAVVGEQPLVVLWAPGSASPLETDDVREGRDVGSAGVYDPRVAGQTLTFARLGPRQFRDRETGSRWSLAGVAVDGPLQGTRLTPLPHQDAFWFAWAEFQPDTEIVRQ